VRIVTFNTPEGWPRDVAEVLAREKLKRAAKRGRPHAARLRQLVETYVDEDFLLRSENGFASAHRPFNLAASRAHPFAAGPVDGPRQGRRKSHIPGVLRAASCTAII
jgi:hypothetical protein